jgi:iron complex outermembrane receptor protein
VKNRFFDRLTLNVEAYLYSYKDQIIAVSDLVNGLTLLANAQKSKIYGIQLDSTLDLAEHTKLRAGIGYLHADFTDFTYNSGGTTLDFSGNKLPFSPKFTAAIGATQTFDLPNQGLIEARADSYLTTSYYFEFSNVPGFKQDGYRKTDLGLTYRSPSRQWELGLWVKNIEDEATAASAGTSPGRSYPGVVYLEPPRTYGARASIKW